MSNLLGTPEVAELLNVSQSTIRYWVVQGVGPKSFKIGRRRVWALDDVEAFISEQRAKGEKEVAR